jgi:hypothetical protein
MIHHSPFFAIFDQGGPVDKKNHWLDTFDAAYVYEGNWQGKSCICLETI